MTNKKPTKEETEQFKFFKAGWDLAKYISNHEGFVFGATNNRCEKEFWKLKKALNKEYKHRNHNKVFGDDSK